MDISEQISMFIENQLLCKVKKMQDGTKIKILLKRISSMINTEVNFRIPKDSNDFDLLFIHFFSEPILQNMENNDDK